MSHWMLELGDPRCQDWSTTLSVTSKRVPAVFYFRYPLTDARGLFQPPTGKSYVYPKLSEVFGDTGHSGRRFSQEAPETRGGGLCINVRSVPLPSRLHYRQVFSPPLPSQPHGKETGFLENLLSYHGGQCLSQLLQAAGSTSSRAGVSLVATEAGSRW